ncbi:hypothetical protein ACJZ2D_006825 [Fusarium nematophilum]
MRRASHNKNKNRKKDRLRDDAVTATANTTTATAIAVPSPVTEVGALPRDEGCQAHPNQFLDSAPVPVSVPNHSPAPVSVSVSVTASSNHAAPDAGTTSASLLDHDCQLHHQLHIQPAACSSHVVSGSAHDAYMTDAFPAEIDAVSAAAAATAATNTLSPAVATPASTATLATSATLHQDHLDIHQNTASTANNPSFHPPLLDDLYNYNPTNPPHLDLHYIHHHGDYDLDMSDSEGGAPLDEDDNHHSSPPEEDNDAQAPPSGPVNYLLHSFQIPTVIGPGLIMDAAPPPEPWAPLPTDGPVPIPQTVPQPPLPAIDPLDDLPPISNPNPTMLGSENLGLVAFLGHWAQQARIDSPLSPMRARAPCPEEIRRQAHAHINDIKYSDLRGDDFDFQGMDWASMGTTRRCARKKRGATYKNYVNKEGSDKWSPHMTDVNIPPRESFLRFKKYLVRQDVYLAHFQLRSILACPSQTQAYYPGARGVNRINPVSGKTEVALNNSVATGLGALISTLDANHGLLMAGTFNGEYYLKNLESEDKKTYSDGQITQSIGGITNHVQIHMPRRSSSPVAAISSNDEGFRVMDLATEKFVMQTRYRFPLNCSRISPDGRLRVMVGDDFKVIITDADTGEIQQELTGHRDYGFACDWSDDGWTVATGFQDKGVKIWDARHWCNSRGISTPLCTIRSEMAGVRNLRFSPVGSGPRVLVAAEEADYVNIINAQTFAKKQTVDIFGEIGGVAFTNDGQDLNVLVSDHHRGGLLQLERCGVGPEPFFRNTLQRFMDRDTGRWLYRMNDFSHIHEPYHRKPISTDSLPIF